MNRKLRVITLSLCLFFTGFASAQLSNYNRWSVDFAGGFNKTMGIRTPTFEYPFADLLNINAGVRYMFNSKIGIKFGGEFDRFSSFKSLAAGGTEKHDSQYLKFGIQGVLNLGRICNYEEWTKKHTLLLHSGAGYGMLTDISKTGKISGIDNIGYVVMGITPIFRVHKRVAITADLSIYGSLLQQRTFDFQTKLAGRPGFDSYFGTASIGATIYLGKNEEHMDWKFEGDDLLKRIEALEADLENTKGDVDLLGQDLKAVEQKMQDDDNDGVANYLDIEPDSKEGATVNTKGQTVETIKADPLIDDNDPAMGLFYTVQLGVFSAQIPEQYWKGITPLYRMKIEDGTTRYFSGIFHSVDEARPKLDNAKGNGLVDAFITAYYKGNRITIAEADLILATRGKGALRPKP
jgi:OmpA-OmpF porin, OOP family